MTLASLREYVGLVQQEAFLFDSTVTNNVAYADPWAEEERIVGATKTAQMHDYIAHLPGGYGTRVGERGVALSGGQRQRMSIARGVVPGPGIMIFDDSTAAIDAVTEKRVRDALAEATRQKATIIIAHRLSSLMHADEIIVLEEGRIVERGTHAELLAQGGEYFDLYSLQSRTEQGLSIADASADHEAAKVSGGRANERLRFRRGERAARPPPAAPAQRQPGQRRGRRDLHGASTPGSCAGSPAS